jgi:hemoglobin-like flavoprotein
MIQGLTEHYRKKGEMWKIDGKSKPDGDGIEPVPIMGEVDSRRAEVVRQLARTTSYRKKLHCSKQVPASDISFTMVENVIMSWEKITQIPKWEKTTGDLFLRYIFKIEPATIDLFGFPAGTDYNDPDLTSNVKFVTKGVVLIKAIDTAVQMLGPDLYPLEDVLYDLGKRHVIMKAQPEFWPIVGEALFLVFEEYMGDAFDEGVRKAWTVMYNFLGYHMIQGLKYQYKLMERKQKKRLTM